MTRYRVTVTHKFVYDMEENSPKEAGEEGDRRAFGDLTHNSPDIQVDELDDEGLVVQTWYQ